MVASWFNCMHGGSGSASDTGTRAVLAVRAGYGLGRFTVIRSSIAPDSDTVTVDTALSA